MSSVVDFIHRAVGALIDFSVSLLAGLGPTWALVVLSLVIGVLLALVYGKISSQERIRSVKKDIHAGMLESVLFRHNSGLALKAQGRMLGGGLRYFLLAVPPILILALPCIFLLGQLNSWFGYSAPLPGHSVLVRATVNAPAAVEQLELRADAGVQVVGPLRALAEKQVLWRLDPQSAGHYSVSLSAPSGAAVPLELSVDSTLARLDPVLSQSISDRLLYPARRMPALPPELAKVEIVFPDREIEFLGFQSHWIVTFLLLSLVGGFAAAKAVGVEL